MPGPRFSVVIPCRDNEQWLPSTLRSLGAQTRRPHEVIVVDDGSTDGSAALARAAGATVLDGGGRGAAVARNLGVDAAGGDWIAFLDADDLWTPEHLARTAELIAGHPADDAVLNHIDHVSPDARDLVRPAPPRPPRPGGRALTGPAGGLDGVTFLRWYDGAGFFPGMTACSVRRSAYLALGGLDPRQPRRHDIDFFLRLAGAGRTWGYDTRGTSLYRAGRPGNISSNLAEREYYLLLSVVRHLDLIRGIDPAAGERLLDKAVRRCLAAAAADGGAGDRRRAVALARPLARGRNRLYLRGVQFAPAALAALVRAKRRRRAAATPLTPA